MMFKFKHLQQPNWRFHFRDIGAWFVKTLLLPIITSILCQFLVNWLNHWLKW